MATITIRNLPDEVVEALKARAKANARSMEADVRDVLTRIAHNDASALEAVVARRFSARRYSVPGDEINAWIEANPAPAVDTEAWLRDIRDDGDIEDFVDPWERAEERRQQKDSAPRDIGSHT